MSSQPFSGAPEAGEIRIEREGRWYRWTESRGLERSDYMAPVGEEARAIRSAIAQQVQAHDLGVKDINEVIRRVSKARDDPWPERYAWLTEHAVALDPRNTAAITCQAKLLRDRGQHEEALRVTAPFAQTTNVALLTVRGHLLADVGQVDEATRVARRAYALAKKTGVPTQPLSVLLTRIEKHRS